MLSFLNFLRDGELDTITVAIRLVLAVICGASLGLERERKRRPAGFRTHILICLGAAMTTLTSQYLVLNLGLFTDMARLGAQVIAGIGFIGAGTIIITKRRQVKGLTTAAGLWATAGIGLAVGCGMYALGVVTAILTLLGLELFPLIFKKAGIHTLLIQYSTSNYSNIKNINDEVSRCKARILNYSAERIGPDDKSDYRVNIIIRSINQDTESHIINYIQQQPDVLLEKVE